MLGIVVRARAACTFVLLGSVALAPAGCLSAPDMKPFTDATAQLSSSMKSAGRAVGDEITEITRPWPEEPRARAGEVRERFQTHWVQRGRLADALNDYSASLSEIVAAGEQGEASALALANSFGTLCGAVGLALPPAMAGEVVATSSARVYGLFARDQAARTLGNGMREMQPALDEVALLLDKDLAAIERALVVLRTEAGDAPYDHTVTPVAGFLPSAERNNLVQQNARLGSLRGKLADVQGRMMDELASDDRSELLAQESYLQSQVSAAETSIAASVQRLAPVNAGIAEAQGRIDTEIQLVKTVRGGLADWSSTHARLADAALERKAPRVDELVEAAVQIRDLVREVRAGKRP